MSEAWKPGTVYLRHTDKNGSAFIQEHWAWNTDDFIENASKSAIKEGGKVEVATREEYRAEHWPQKS